MTEIWKDIAGYEGLYQVSNCGRVRSFKSGEPRILKLRLNTNGYLRVCLYRGGKCKHAYVHQLVAKTFIDNADNKPCVNHINGVKTDNRVENLERVTYSENTQHALTTGLMTQAEDRYNARFTNEQARFIRENPDGLTESGLARLFGVNPMTIGRIRQGKCYRNAGGAVRKTRPRAPQIPDEVRAEIRRLYVRGSQEFGSRALAEAFNVSKSVILKIVHEN